MNQLLNTRSSILAAMRKGVLPAYPIALAAYPIIAMLVHNRAEVPASVAVRPLMISLAAVSISLIIFRAVSGSWRKAALLTTLGLFAFFIYGRVYAQLQNATLLDFVIGRHRYLVPFFGLLLLAGVLVVLRIRSDLDRATQALNVFAVTLILIPLGQFGVFLITEAAGSPRAVRAEVVTESLIAPPGGNWPDIYFIVLDTYTRADAMYRDFSFDNSSFIEALEDRGFYVAECARPNYIITSFSLASTLNLAYLDESLASNPDLPGKLAQSGRMLRDSEVRRLLEEAGYRTVAFETAYEWSSLRDADYFLSLRRDPITLQQIDPFERMLLYTTALRVIVDLEVQRFESDLRDIDEVTSISEFLLAPYVDRHLFIFDQLPEIARLSERTFAFVHITTPHGPYVFDPDGNIWSDKGFYSGVDLTPIDESYLIRGYTAAIQFTNKRILEAIDQIFERSRIPPIIIMQGDHGVSNYNRLQIFSSYFLPGENGNQLYPSISPVNSFRVVFNAFFGGEFDLVEDFSYGYGSTEPAPERSEFCRKLDSNQFGSAENAR